MKYCEEYAALLDPFVDGELPPEEMERVRAHLETCSGCQAYVDDALAIRAGFADIEDTVVPEGFAEGVMERVRKDAGKGAKAVEMRRRSLRRWTGTVAALAACCALVIALRTGSGGWSGGGAPIDRAGGDAGIPAYDTCTTGDTSPADGIAPQMAAEDAPVSGEAGPEGDEAEEQLELRMTSKQEKDAVQVRTYNKTETAETGEMSLAAAPAEAAPEEADAGLQLYLSAGEVGDLLEDFAPAWETETERAYELSAEECGKLLKALGRESAEAPLLSGTVLVVITEGH